MLPTYVGFSAEYYLLFMASVFTLEYKAWLNLWTDFISAPFSGKNLVVWVVASLMVFSLANKLFNGIEINSLKDYYASFYLFPFLILVSKIGFDKKMFKVLIFFTAIEAIVGIMEYSMGVKTFFMDIGELNQIKNYNLLYDSNVYGLSTNSSILGLKVLVAFVLIDYVKFHRLITWIVRVLLLIALLISFSRIVIIVALIYWTFVFTVKFVQSKGKIIKRDNFQFYALVLLLVMIFPKSIMNQFTRGSHKAESIYVEESESRVSQIAKKISSQEITVGPIVKSSTKPNDTDAGEGGIGDWIFSYAESIQSSGRKLIWINYLNFIEKDFWFGYGSDKLMFQLWVDKTESFKLIHAHNSYLMLLASNGVLISFLYFIVYLLLFKSKNYLALGVILLYSFGNYGIFWGFSYLDFIFIVLLIHNLKPNYDT